MDFPDGNAGAQPGDYAGFIDYLRQSLETGAQEPDTTQFSGYGVTPLGQTVNQLQRIAGE